MNTAIVVLSALLWKIPLVYILVSIGEWVSHKYLLHGRWIHDHVPLLAYIYREHHIEHHGHDRMELRPHIDLFVWDYWLAMPFFAVAAVRFFWFGQIGGLSGMIALFSVCFVHWWLWNHIHRATHDLAGGDFVTRLPFYPALRRNHLDHHKRTTKNYGVAFGWWIDWLLGTQWRSG